jgi:hypothetical protein
MFILTQERPAPLLWLSTPNTSEEISNEREALGWQNNPD